MYAGYQQAANEVQESTAPNQLNRALQFTRFYPYLAKDAAQRKTEKSDWLKKFAGSTGDTKLLDAHYQRMLAFAQKSAASAQVLEFTTAWRFVTGTGDPHPVENGFAWHPSLCVPYLPAASVKGLARAFATEWLAWPAEDIARIFGAGNIAKAAKQAASEVPEGAGSVIFFEMLPRKPVRLMVDVMTPHQGQWYAQGGTANITDHRALPAPWHNPIPIPFLVVEDGHFHLLLQARRGAQNDLQNVLEMLPQALEIAGAGAKTATGYGRFTQDTRRLAEEQAQAERAQRAAQQEAEKLAREQAIALIRNTPTEEKLAGILLDLHQKKKQTKALAQYLCSAKTNKKLGEVLAQQNLTFAELKAALMADVELLNLLRGWNGKAGDEGKAYAVFAPLR